MTTDDAHGAVVVFDDITTLARTDVREPRAVERCLVAYDGLFERVRGRGVEVEGDGWDDWDCAIRRGRARRV
jgi:hypothetical protein